MAFHLFNKSKHSNAVGGTIMPSVNQRRCYGTSREESQCGATSRAQNHRGGQKSQDFRQLTL